MRSCRGRRSGWGGHGRDGGATVLPACPHPAVDTLSLASGMASSPLEQSLANSGGIASSGSAGTSGTFSMTCLRSSGVALPARCRKKLAAEHGEHQAAVGGRGVRPRVGDSYRLQEPAVSLPDNPLKANTFN